MPRRTVPAVPSRRPRASRSQSEASATLSSTSSKPTLAVSLCPVIVSSPDAQGVLAAQLQRVHAQALGQQVHLALAGEHDLRLAEAAEGAAGDLVRAHHARVHLDVGHAVGAAGVHGAAEEHHRRQRRVGAAVEEVVHLGRDQVPVRAWPPCACGCGPGWRLDITAMSSSRDEDEADGRARWPGRGARPARPGAEGASSLPPKPPPVTVCTMRARLRSQPRAEATAFCT